MLYDRPYMKKHQGGGSFSVLKWVLIINTVFFLLENVFTRWFGSSILIHYGALWGRSLETGFIWALLTYGFLHQDIFHFLFNFCPECFSNSNTLGLS